MRSYRLEKQDRCVICGSDRFKNLGKRGPSTHKWLKDLPEKDLDDPELEKVHAVKCCECGLIWANPFPIKELKTLQEEYKVEYLEDKTSKRMHSQVIERIEGWIPKDDGRALLDIGCGLGGFLCAAKARGWYVEGLELSKTMCEYIRNKYGFEVSNIIFEEYRTNRKFDAAILAEVLEHVREPMEILVRINRVLKKGGIAYFYVPNEDSLFHKIFRPLLRLIGKKTAINLSPTVSPYHLYGFSMNSLSQALKRSGFEILRMDLKSGGFQISYTESDGLLSRFQKKIANSVLSFGYMIGQGFYVEAYARKIHDIKGIV